MAGRTQEIIKAIFGCRDPQGICGSPIYKVPNYRANSSAKCTPNFATLVNSDSTGVQTYGGNAGAGASGCCDDDCGGAAGKIPISNKLPVGGPIKAPTYKAPAPATKSGTIKFGTGSTAPQPTFFGG